MKRSQAFPGNYLAKDDAHAPIQAVIQDVARKPVQCEHGHEDKPVMTFTAEQMKPLILNNVNWMICEDLFGEDSDDWRGKTVEIYTDPNVMFGTKRVGGLRLRIPAPAQVPAPAAPPGPPPAVPPVPAATPKPAPVPPPAPKPGPAPRPAPTPMSQQTLLEKFDRAKQAFASAKTLGRVEELYQHAKQYPWTDEQEDELADAYHGAKERIQGTDQQPDQRAAMKRGA